MEALEAVIVNMKNIEQRVINCFLLLLPSCRPQMRMIVALHQ